MSEHFAHAVAGALASLLSILLLYPINQAGFIIQVRKRASNARWPWISQVFRELLSGGPSRLYAGAGPVLVATTVSQGIYFAIYEALGGLVIWRSGASAVLSVLLTSPVWVVAARLRLEQGGGTSRGVVGAMLARGWRITQSEGARALWDGLASSLWLCLTPVLQFWLYECLRVLAPGPSALAAFCLGGLAKMLAAIATLPFQVAQSRQRARSGASSLPRELRALLSEGGLLGLFAGVEARALAALLNGALTMCFYERILQLTRTVLSSGPV